MRRAAHDWTCWMLSTICAIALLMSGLGTVPSAWGDEPKVEPRPASKAIAPTVRRTIKLNLSKSKSPSTAPTPPAAPATDANGVPAVPTHRQASIVQVNSAGQKPIKLSCFCVAPDDRILAGGTAESGEIRVFDVTGKYLETWPMPINPEALFVRADGLIFVAGDGQVLKLSAKGAVELKKVAPHAAALNEHPEKLREEVIAQVKQQAEQLGKQTKLYDQMIERADKEIASIKEQIAALKKPADSSATESDAQLNPKNGIAARKGPQAKPTLERRLAMYEQQKKVYGNAKDQFAKIMETTPTAELTDKQIDERVKASLAYKLKASSISATGDDVFLAAHAAAGYGFNIWRCDDQFENAALIVKDLSGCCGQMDVKANEDGVFVAENSRHRVCRFDRDGKELGAWGQSARTGIEGFGSCCNPMNVAFGPEKAVYTAEDDTGRIKRYSVDGKLLGLVGSVDLKPGCKNCSIAVGQDGSRVYMLDVTRNYIVQLNARPAEEVAADIEAAKKAPPVAQPEGEANAATPASASTSSSVLRGLQALFSSGK